MKSKLVEYIVCVCENEISIKHAVRSMRSDTQPPAPLSVILQSIVTSIKRDLTVIVELPGSYDIVAGEVRLDKAGRVSMRADVWEALRVHRSMSVVCDVVDRLTDTQVKDNFLERVGGVAIVSLGGGDAAIVHGMGGCMMLYFRSLHWQSVMKWPTDATSAKKMVTRDGTVAVFS